MQYKIMISCEHASNTIPPRYLKIFQRHTAVLETHRGWDPGALILAKHLAKSFNAPLYYGLQSRLLIDLNRSCTNRSLFSTITRSLSKLIKQEIIEKYHTPYHQCIFNEVKNVLSRKQRVLHLSIHSFTPVLENKTRQADIGLLYDPQQNAEKFFCSSFKKRILQLDPTLKVRMNYPYKGNQDSLTTALRKTLGSQHYLGLEIEINQKLFYGRPSDWKMLQDTISRALLD
ncbi:MAG: N-formylglutamate amidohydrolase [Chlamydiota bacterium]|nr:N-formylglutamate amidohydrolase [Chlamydiota bacterium]